MKPLSTSLFSLLVIVSTIVIATVGANSVLGNEAAAPAAKSELPAVGVEKAPVAPIIADQSASVVESKSSSVNQMKPESDSEAQARKGRSEAPPQLGADKKSSDSDSAKLVTEKPASVAETKSSTMPANGSSKQTAASDQQQPRKQPTSGSAKSQLTGKSSSGAKKPASNLGTVTSTGSGGPAHYMSKHDAYSAIAEKHGALAQDAMRKSDKTRNHLQRFGGIQKASGGLGDMLSPFKGVTDSGLARTLGASMRSIMKGKYSVPAYVASALLGAVALMAFYESPMSPLPVPALPEPPVGRFPPEMPSLPPGTQVPFRGSQQYNQNAYGAYGANQRSSYQAPIVNQQQQQQPQQVLFPGLNVNQAAQQRQSGGSQAGPVQQLAANLLSNVGGKQNAQRKSGPDRPDASSRSIFGSLGGSTIGAGSPSFLLSPFGGSSAAKLSAPANSNGNQQQHKQQQQQQSSASLAGSSLLSFFGLGGAGASQPAQGNSDQLQASASSGLSQYASSLVSIEPKGQGASGLSNSHVVNKVKSYFSSRPAIIGGGQAVGGLSSSLSPAGSFSSSSTSNSAANPYDEYQRMSFVQALMKDTAFLPAFLMPSRKHSPTSSSPAASSSASAPIGSGQPAASTRMQVDSSLPLIGGGLQQQQQHQLTQPANVRRTSSLSSPAPAPAANAPPSHFGLGRIAHALLDTFTSGVMQRSAAPDSRKSSQAAAAAAAAATAASDQQSAISLASATSLLTDIMSNYQNSQQAASQQQQQQQQQFNSNIQSIQEQQQQQQHQQQVEANNKQQQQDQQLHNYQHQQAAQPGQQQSGSDLNAAGRSLDAGSVMNSAESLDLQAPKQVSSANSKPSASSNSATAAVGTSSSATAATATESNINSAVHSRKTRSIGLEYPVDTNQAIARREQLQPSRAAQINNLVDFVADSYSQNRLLFNFVMNQVGLSHAVPYVEQILVPGKENNSA